VHVESCERCASRLIDLSDRETSGIDKATDEAPLAQVVRADWAPPADLAERVIRGIDERQRNERDLSVMLGLSGVATETASLMLQPDPETPEAGGAAPASLPNETEKSNETNGSQLQSLLAPG
jgi:hypothetical protein